MFRTDVTVQSEVRTAIERIEETMPPLRGVYHAAMVLDDALLYQLDESRLSTVMAPKIDGAWNLHLETLRHNLDQFVLFSSVSSWGGGVGQANYNAANAFIEGLAHYRKSLKLPALAVHWGAISEVGYVARNPEIERQLERMGLLGVNPADATYLLGKLLAERTVEAGVLRFDLPTLVSVTGDGAVHRRYSHIIDSGVDGSSGQQDAGNSRELIQSILLAPEEERLSRLEALLGEQVSSVLGIPSSRLEPEAPLAQLGLDSLMSVEIETGLQSALGVKLPMGYLVGQNVSLRRLSERVLEEITKPA